MATAPLNRAGIARTGSLLLAAAARQGSASHPWFASAALLQGPEASRNLADAVHFLSTLHGRHPGVIDLASGRTADPAARRWLFAAAEAFAAERLYLGRLAVAVGPVPGTPGGAASETALRAQQGAMATLGSSERQGCAFGAALALAADWARVRKVLDVAAERVGVEAPALALGSPEEIGLVADAAGTASATERAMLFGAEQILIQQRSIWDILEARAEARRG